MCIELPATGSTDRSLMHAAIPLSDLLSNALDDLMRRDGTDGLADYPSARYSSRLKADDDSIIVIKASHAERPKANCF